MLDKLKFGREEEHKNSVKGGMSLVLFVLCDNNGHGLRATTARKCFLNIPIGPNPSTKINFVNIFRYILAV